MNPYKKSETPCKCPCHDNDSVSLHMMPCCNLTYEKYITKGVVDMPLWTELNEKSFMEIMELRAKRNAELAEKLLEDE